MPVDQLHPLHAARAADWRLVRDCLAGEGAVKGRLEAYLPMTPGQRLETPRPASNADYLAYQGRADFPDLVRLTLDACGGLIHRRPATVSLPPELEPLRRSASPDGLGLADLHRRLTRNVLLTGRHGLLVDAPAGGAALPYVADYTAESMVNWREEGGRADMVVLREDHPLPGPDPFAHVTEPRWRVLTLGAAGYRQGLWHRRDEEDFARLAEYAPGGAAGLDELPFVFVGATDLTPAPHHIPMLPLARMALRIFRLSADYKQALFLTSQPTPVIAGVEPGQEGLPEQIGASTIWYLPAEARAYYLEVGGAGIEAHRQAIGDLQDQALQMGARLMEGGRGAESAEALRIRAAAQTVSLTDVARTTAAGLERALRMAARWAGADPDRVTVEPNLDFTENVLSAEAVRQLTQAWKDGAFDRSVLAWNLRRGGRLPEDGDHGLSHNEE